MEGLIVILLGFVAAIPISIIVLLVRQGRMQDRLAELEATIRQLEQRISREAAKASAPVANPLQPAKAVESPIVAAEPFVATPVPREEPATSAPPPLLTEAAAVAKHPAIPPADQPHVWPRKPQIPTRVVDWEKFLGVKLFAWIGGFALFLGVAFFIKYSFEHNLVAPAVRVALGFVTGIGLLVGGLLMRRKEYAVTSQTLCATGVVVLYAVSFASHGVYHLIGSGPAFAIMTLITAAAFLLSVRLDAKVVAVLGLVGGFTTPPLLATGQHNPVGLFGYIVLLDIGLLGAALNRRWHFLLVLGVLGTAIIELGWVFRFFQPEKAFTLIAVMALFNIVEAISFCLSERLKQPNREAIIASIIQSAVTFFVSLYAISLNGMEGRPGALLTLILIADGALLFLPAVRSDLFRVQLLAGGAALCSVGAWLKFAFREQDLYWALAATLVFAILHSVYPLYLQRKQKITGPVGWLNVFPLGAIGLMLLVLLQLDSSTFTVWPVIFLLDLLVIGLALLTVSVAGALGAVVLTGLFTMTWLLRLPRDITGSSVVLILGVFALLFFAAGIWLSQKTAATLNQGESAEASIQRYLPAISAFVPFLLLALMIARLSVPNPSNIFGLALVLALMLLWLGKRMRAEELHVTALGATLFLEYYWHQLRFQPARAEIGLTWYLLFYALFVAYPFGFRKELQERVWPWVASALSGPLHFYLIYKAGIALLPNFKAMGLIPAVLAVPSLIALSAVLKGFRVTEDQKVRLLALFGGSALFFITMVFPIQLSRQWLTVGWALEGAALLWLYTRVPHRGLPMVGVTLLVVAFARLALNPNVFSYYARSETRIFNWYLYSYGIVVACLLAGGRLLAPPRQLVLGRNAQPLLFSLGTVLAFILLNIEIADFFAEGNVLRFEFSGNFARDMTYSIAWALFALVLLLIGIRKDLAPVRYAGLGLLGATLLKLFFHDLSQLGQLYRIGAFIGVAIILIFASWVYQRFLAAGGREKAS